MTTYKLKEMTRIGRASLDDEPWEFYLVEAWRDPQGGLYLVTDSGCSCPSPFEWLRDSSQMTGPLTKAQAAQEIESLRHVAYGGDSDYVKTSIRELIQKVKGLA